MDKKLVEYLFEIEAVKLNTTNYFVWASGIKSPIYTDNRQILSYPHIRSYVVDLLKSLIIEKFPDANSLAAVATGAIAFGAILANNLNLPMVYVRSKPKDHGLENIIEGKIDKNYKMVVVEDLISTGGSSLFVVDTLRKAGINVLGLVSIFSYNLKKANENFQNAKCVKYSLLTFDDLVQIAFEKGFIQKEQIASLKQWRDSLM